MLARLKQKELEIQRLQQQYKVSCQQESLRAAHSSPKPFVTPPHAGVKHARSPTVGSGNDRDKTSKLDSEEKLEHEEKMPTPTSFETQETMPTPTEPTDRGGFVKKQNEENEQWAMNFMKTSLLFMENILKLLYQDLVSME